jgi:hypothetical protein
VAAKRFRLKHTFWLDVTKADERDLAARIEDLKEQRRFSQTIRDGIRLISDLRAGRTETLFALFPWLAAELSVVSEGRGELSLERQLEELRALIVSQNGAALAGFDDGLASLQPLRRAAFEDDDAVDLRVTATSDGASAQNFLNSLLNLQQ